MTKHASMALGHWIQATRPRTLPAGIAPVAVGWACASQVVATTWSVVLLCLLGALLIQVGCNFANDAFDARKGADTPARLGPTRAVAAGLISEGAMLCAAGVVLLVAFAIGCWLARSAGWPILVIGLASVIAAILYTGGPLPYGYHGLGDGFVLIFFGFCAVLGTAWCLLAAGDGAVPPGPLWWAMPVWWWSMAAAVGLQATAILAVNNLRDRQTDELAGKRTLAVRLGDRGTRIYYLLLHLGAVACLAWAAWASAVVLLWAAVLLALGGGLLLARQVARRHGRELNACLARSAGLELATAALVVLGLTRPW